MKKIKISKVLGNVNIDIKYTAIIYSSSLMLDEGAHYQVIDIPYRKLTENFLLPLH